MQYKQQDVPDPDQGAGSGLGANQATMWSTLSPKHLNMRHTTNITSDLMFTLVRGSKLVFSLLIPLYFQFWTQNYQDL